MSNKELPKKKIVVSDAALPFVARGGRIFCRNVKDAPQDILDGEEVLVVDKNDRALFTARAVV
jgi:archaeosine-15-forming tRNA-guanine transglycosylase